VCLCIQGSPPSAMCSALLLLYHQQATQPSTQWHRTKPDGCLRALCHRRSCCCHYCYRYCYHCCYCCYHCASSCPQSPGTCTSSSSAPRLFEARDRKIQDQEHPAASIISQIQISVPTTAVEERACRSSSRVRSTSYTKAPTVCSAFIHTVQLRASTL
jgi:hypothetical protein